MGAIAGTLEGKVALVVGGGADGPPRPGETVAMGNGRSIAARLGAAGASVAVTDIALERAQETVDVIGAGLAIRADAGIEADCRGAVEQTLAAFGRIDIVVANVAVPGRMPLRSQTMEDFERAMRVNVTGHWITAQAALPSMLEQGSGTFVFVGSAAGIQSPGRSLAYEVSKAGQLALMRHIAVRYGARGIRSNALVLGVIDSTMVRRGFGVDPVAEAARGSVSPMRRQGTTDEVGDAALFLASDASSYVNGQSLMLDGGTSIAWPAPSAPAPAP
ncbi:SDR family oxidoreductase [Nocardioides sp. zg-ZUI104]|uniref:SDR family NAD(P)-dependent oxidoreductase n=1 Tax=Nocardioides faecalis TaxID=2803858 RepID=UPI001BCA9E59|nr:SDR family oxidoreductase [Nocardioides faecalis]MBS4754542.1 SDR family oxidoreductase [Nocardioides faecalis]